MKSVISIMIIHICHLFSCDNDVIAMTYLVKSVISIIIIHICLAVTMMSLPLSSHLATSLSSLAFSTRNISNCAWIFSFSSGGRALIMARSDLPWRSSWSVCQLAVIDLHCGFTSKATIFMPPTSKKLRGHIGLGLSVQCSE